MLDGHDVTGPYTPSPNNWTVIVSTAGSLAEDAA